MEPSHPVALTVPYGGRCREWSANRVPLLDQRTANSNERSPPARLRLLRPKAHRAMTFPQTGPRLDRP